jgi:hypothetical protein
VDTHREQGTESDRRSVRRRSDSEYGRSIKKGRPHPPRRQPQADAITDDERLRRLREGYPERQNPADAERLRRLREGYPERQNPADAERLRRLREGYPERQNPTDAIADDERLRRLREGYSPRRRPPADAVTADERPRGIGEGRPRTPRRQSLAEALTADEIRRLRSYLASLDDYERRQATITKSNFLAAVAVAISADVAKEVGSLAWTAIKASLGIS